MSTLITSGIQISVKAKFRQDLSEVTDSQFFFNYMIEIENTNNFDVQLISRDWYIFDSLNEARYVTGAGVVGEQPVLKSEERFVYTSGADLKSELGMMKGFYTFKNGKPVKTKPNKDLIDGETFQVFVPTFLLEYPYKLN